MTARQLQRDVRRCGFATVACQPAAVR